MVNRNLHLPSLASAWGMSHISRGLEQGSAFNIRSSLSIKMRKDLSHCCHVSNVPSLSMLVLKYVTTGFPKRVHPRNVTHVLVDKYHPLSGASQRMETCGAHTLYRHREAGAKMMTTTVTRAQLAQLANPNLLQSLSGSASTRWVVLGKWSTRRNIYLSLAPSCTRCLFIRRKNTCEQQWVMPLGHFQQGFFCVSHFIVPTSVAAESSILRKAGVENWRRNAVLKYQWRDMKNCI